MDMLSVRTAREAASIGRSGRIQGWIRTRRDSKGGFSFLEVNDGSSLANLQVIADATLENVTQLVDSRLSYDVGRLELRVGTRLAKVDGRDDLQAYLRIVRHIGQY